ncbi:hypothetical protein ACIQNU_02445 [Streptomyces sp. NPDC091292]|uniref:hypothetical protein n=1 Tax=Streptomyces sp. NPDC091292 TaxID=3365991 RepID=UPI00381BC1F7
MIPLRTRRDRTLRRLHTRHPHYTRWDACRTGSHTDCGAACSGNPQGRCCACSCPCHTTGDQP